MGASPHTNADSYSDPVVRILFLIRSRILTPIIFPILFRIGIPTQRVKSI